jgi:CDP-glucose 4,6-dehydratase
MGTINVLEAIRNTSSVKVAVMITTDKCYENKEQIWGYRENEAMGGL